MCTPSLHRRWRFLSSLVSIMSVSLFVSACAGAMLAGQSALHLPPTQAPQIDWRPVDQAMGKKGAAVPGGVERYSFPRTDLNVSVQGVRVLAPFALGGYVVFLPTTTTRAMVMGDLVLTEDEVNPVISQLQQGGIQQTALHNHLLFETPRVMYLHLGGEGDPVLLARAIHAALVQTKTPLTTPPPGQPGRLDLDTKQLDTTLGYQGKTNNGVYQYSIPRAETITDGGVTIPPAMGVATVVNFQPTGQGNAAITGDFVLTAKEVPPVLRTLRDQGITVTALHSHMLTDSPHLFFIHFWANAPASQLARGLRAALDQTGSTKATT